MGLFNRKKKRNQEPEQINPAGLNYDNVDSNAKAIALFNEKKLVKLFLMPLEFGGEDQPTNTLYVPAFIPELKQRFDSMIEKMLRDGKKLAYTTTPEYKGRSFVPSSITITVTGDANFTETIHIW